MKVVLTILLNCHQRHTNPDLYLNLSLSTDKLFLDKFQYLNTWFTAFSWNSRLGFNWLLERPKSLLTQVGPV